jgi:acetyl esterase
VTGYQPTRPDRVQRATLRALLGAPAAVTRPLAGPPVVLDGQTLDPQYQLGLRVTARLGGPELEVLPVDQARHLLEQQAWLVAGRPATVGSVRDLLVEGRAAPIPARLYLPPAGAPGRTATPLVVWFHGGGWVLGSVDSHDGVARALCRQAEVAVLSVGYRLAPEHRFPAAFDDALDSFRWAHAHATELGIDAGRIAVAGDSAGGNLAAAVSLEASRDGGPAPAFQLLFVPAVDLSRRRRSFELFGRGFSLTAAAVDWYQDQYLGAHGDPTDPRVSPLLVDNLAGLPPAYLAVAGFDPLRDEGEEYAARLREARVPVSLRRHAGAIHPFISTLVSDLGRRALTEAVGALRVGLGVSSI